MFYLAFGLVHNDVSTHYPTTPQVNPHHIIHTHTTMHTPDSDSYSLFHFSIHDVRVRVLVSVPLPLPTMHFAFLFSKSKKKIEVFRTSYSFIVFIPQSLFFPYFLFFSSFSSFSPLLSLLSPPPPNTLQTHKGAYTNNAHQECRLKISIKFARA